MRYALEYEAFPGSGRWYRGPLEAGQARTPTAESAVALLEAMPWRFCGGSYFHSTGRRHTGPLQLDPDG